MRHLKFLACVLLIAGVAHAQPVIDIVDLGGGSFDIEVSDLGPDATARTLGAIGGETFNSASFAYTVDPNSGQNLITQEVPRREGRTDVTFVHLPAEQNAWRRFDFRSVPAVISVPWRPHNWPVIAEPDEIEVAWSDAPGGDSFGAGYVARVVLDVSATGFVAGEVLATAGGAPADATVLAAGRISVATDAFTEYFPGMTWTVYAIPEPSTLALLLAGLGCVHRRPG